MPPENFTCIWWILCGFFAGHFFQFCNEFFIAFQKIHEYHICNLFKLGSGNWKYPRYNPGGPCPGIPLFHITIFFTGFDFDQYTCYTCYAICVQFFNCFWVITKPFAYPFSSYPDFGTFSFTCFLYFAVKKKLFQLNPQIAVEF